MGIENVIAKRPTKVVYRDGDSAVKLFESNHKKSDILNEALNQVRVEETGINMAKLRSVSLIDGKWAITSDYIPGKTLEQLMKENPEKEDEYLERFVDIQIDIVSKTSPLLTKIKDKMNSQISLADLDATVRYDLHTRLDSMPKHNKVCHGDYNPGNVIITPDDEAYVIDWSHATQGNASADVARTYLQFCLYYTKELAEKYLNLFCEKTNTAKKYVQSWMPIVAAAQSIKDRPGEREFLLSWINVVDYD